MTHDARHARAGRQHSLDDYNLAATPPERLRNHEGPEVPEGSSSRPSSLHGFSLL